MNADPLITVPDIARAFHVATSTIRKYLIKHHVYNVNKYDEFLINKFDIIDTEEKAYWIGFLAADGNVSITTLALALAEKDLHHLLKFKKFIGVDYKITLEKKKMGEKIFIGFRYTVSSTNFASSLAKHGLVPRKSLILQFPTTIPDNLIHHYIRGLVDGDGCYSISDNELSFSLISSLNVCETVQKYLMKNCDLSQTELQEFTAKTNEKYYNIRYGGTPQVCKITNYLYQDANIFLERKKELVDNFVTTHEFHEIEFSSDDITKILLMNSDPQITVIDIARSFDLASQTIKKQLIKYNVYNANKYDEFLINKFDIIDTEEKSYWIGFLHGNGNVNSRQLSLELTEKDLSHLLKFKKFIGVDYKISEHKTQIDGKPFIGFRYIITSVNFARSLAKHGLTPRKLLKLQFPNTIPNNLIHHYMRGLVDGKGSYYITNNKLIFSLTSSLNICEAVQSYLVQNCNLSKTELIEHLGKNNEKSYNIRYIDAPQVCKIANYLYQDAHVFLDRKKEIIDDFVSTHKFMSIK